MKNYIRFIVVRVKNLLSTIENEDNRAIIQQIYGLLDNLLHLDLPVEKQSKTKKK